MTSDSLIIPAMLGGSAAFAGAVTYALVGRDLRGRGRVAVALISAVLVGGMSLVVLYLSVAAFLVCAVSYLVVRRFLRPGLALAASGALLFGGLSCAVVIISVAVSQM